MEATSNKAGAAPAHKPFFKSLYFQVLTAILLGVLLGHFYPQLGEQMKPLGDAFIKLIKMIIAPIIFCTVVHGIASMQDMKKVGRVGLKALALFRARDDACADRRPDRDQHAAARCRHERRSVRRSIPSRSKASPPSPRTRARSGS